MVQTDTARLVLVDDHEVVRRGLRALIDLEDDLMVVGEAETAKQAVELVESECPDLVVMDLRLPDRSGVSACRDMRERCPSTRVVILSSSDDPTDVLAAEDAGAVGYLVKDMDLRGLIENMRKALRGEAVFVPAAAGRPSPEEPTLSPQEEILASHLARGLTNRQIADEMGLAEKTVKNYVSNVLTKLGTSRRSEAAALIARAEAMRRPIRADRR